MRRAERLFDIIQVLRGARRPLTATFIAARLEVSARTIYRDIAALQGSAVPIEGAAGLGYVLREGFDLPPLMFTSDEVQSILVALQLVRRTGDRGLQDAAEQARSKILAVLPSALRADAGSRPAYVSQYGARVPDAVCMGEVRDAIRAARKLRIDYADGQERPSRRTIWPLAVVYYAEATIIAAWCELRCDYRHFRADRIAAIQYLDARYPSDSGRLLAGWRATHMRPHEGSDLRATL